MRRPQRKITGANPPSPLVAKGAMARRRQGYGGRGGRIMGTYPPSLKLRRARREIRRKLEELGEGKSE